MLQPIETAPKDGTPILVFGGHDDNEKYAEKIGPFFHAPRVAFWDGEDWIFGFAEACYVAIVRVAPTHWMPLPETTD